MALTNAFVDRKNRIGWVEFPDGSLITCYDDTPDDQIKGVIREKVNAIQPERKKFVSDLAGYDPKEYDGSEQEVVRTVVAWLLPRNETSRLKPELNPSTVFKLLDEFKDSKKKLSDKWLGEIPWDALIDAAINTAEKINPDVRRLKPLP